MTLPVAVHDLQSRFYSKLAQISEDVVAGAHPRFKLPPADISKLQSFHDPALGKPAEVNTTAATGQTPLEQDQVACDAQQSSPTETHPAASGPSSQPLSVPITNPSKESGFLPYLLEKSPALIRAESEARRQREEQGQRQEHGLRLKRKRLENKLKEAFEKWVDDSNKKELANWDGPISFDVAQLDKTATDTLAKTSSSSLLNAGANSAAASPNSSFDVNSYYSSQVNEHWTSDSDGGTEEGEVVSDAEVTRGASAGMRGTQARVEQNMNNRRKHPSGTHQLKHAALPAKPPQTSPSTADVSAQLGKEKPISHGHIEHGEESYSPPSPEAFRKRVPPRGPRALRPPAREIVRDQTQKRHHESESYSPPSPAVPIIQNHLGAPVAPQPSRISPLTGRGRYPSGPSSGWQVSSNPDQAYQDQQMAPTRGPYQQQRHPGNRNGQHLSKRERRRMEEKSRHEQQPTQLHNPPHNRKRRREFDEATYTRVAQPVRPGPTNKNRVSQKQYLPERPSPEPYIKSEPVSPPPLSAYPMNNNFDQEIPRRVVLRDDDYADVQVISPRAAALPRNRSTRQIPFRDDYADYGARGETHRFSDRTPSASAVIRRSPYDQRDLRRVASFHNASQPPRGQTPTRHEYYDGEEARPAHLRPQRQSIRDDAEYIRVPRNQASTQYGSPLQGYEEYSPSMLNSRREMPPPAKKRIIVLENGEEWEATQKTPAESHQSQAPETRHQDVGTRYIDDLPRERPYPRLALPALERSRRQQVLEMDSDQEYQRMPPPPLHQATRHRLVDDQLQRALSYAPQSRQRAISMQPVGQSTTEDRYGHGLSSGMHAEPAKSYVSGRAYSARPNFVEEPTMFERESRYDLR